MTFHSMTFLTIILLLTISLHPIESQNEDEINKTCKQQNTFDNCLLADKLCAWCSDPEYGIVQPRCMLQTEMYNSACNGKFILITKDIPAIYTMNKVLKDFDKDDMSVVQIQPQKIDLVLQKSTPKEIKFKYKQAKNYPLDLYFLTDFMYGDKTDFVEMTKLPSKAMLNLTENYRLGFGSFIENSEMLFAVMEKPKNSHFEHHGPTNDFWHQLSLTGNISKFIDYVRVAQPASNLENIASGFDALMQILVCEREIGWSNVSRRIVVYGTHSKISFTDHHGQLDGIGMPNDKQCYLDANGLYTKTPNMNYPSLEEIYRVFLEQKTNIIFLVNYIDFKFGYPMDDVSSIRLLKDDSSNMLELIREEYTKFVETVKFFHNAPEYISIKFYSSCDGIYPTLTSINETLCNNAIEPGREYEILVTLELLEFPENDALYNQVIKIEEASLRSEYLELNVKMEKPCECIEQQLGESKDQICNHNDELQRHANVREFENLCQEPLTELLPNGEIERSNLICSDRGECVNGHCLCNLGYNGDYCQCAECPSISGLECGGSENIQCNCGQCECRNGYNCSCSNATDDCIPPYIEQNVAFKTDKLCSDNGICECNECVCKQNYFGQFCEIDRGFDEHECKFYIPCIACIIDMKEGEECNNIEDVCQDRKGLEFMVDFVNSLPAANKKCSYYRTKHENNDRICNHIYSFQIDTVWRTKIRIVYDSCIAPNFIISNPILFISTIVVGLGILGLYILVTSIV